VNRMLFIIISRYINTQYMNILDLGPKPILRLHELTLIISTNSYVPIICDVIPVVVDNSFYEKDHV
jgi:hypothetical protein